LYLGRATEALALLDEALALEPDAPIALLLKAHTLADLARLDEAGVMLESLRVHVGERRLPVFDLHMADHAVARARGEHATADAALAAIMALVNAPGTSPQTLGFIQGFVVPRSPSRSSNALRRRVAPAGTTGSC
jgi:hypothetical protein